MPRSEDGALLLLVRLSLPCLAPRSCISSQQMCNPLLMLHWSQPSAASSYVPRHTLILYIWKQIFACYWCMTDYFLLLIKSGKERLLDPSSAQTRPLFFTLDFHFSLLVKIYGYECAWVALFPLWLKWDHSHTTWSFAFLAPEIPCR